MKTYAHLDENSVVTSIISLDDAVVIGKDIFTSDMAKSFVDVTGVNPQPAQGWTTSDGGKTFTAPVEPDAAQGVLLALAESTRNAYANAGVDVDVGAQGNPLVISVDTTTTGRTNLSGLLQAYQEGVRADTDTTPWYQSNTIVQLTKSQLLLAAKAAMARVEQAYAIWHTLVTDIQSQPPKVTKISEIATRFKSS